MTRDVRTTADVDQQAAYEEVWQTFQGLEQAAPHRRDWVAWADKRSALLLCHAPFAELAGHQYLRRVQGALQGLRGVELIPPDFWHLSIQSFGFLPRRPSHESDAAGAAELAEIHARVRPALASMSSFSVEIGVTNAFRSCVILEVQSAGALAAVRTAIRSALGCAINQIDPWSEHLFHVTVAYLDEHADLDRLRDELRALRRQVSLDRPTVAIRELHLSVLPADGRIPFPALEPYYRWRLSWPYTPIVTDPPDHTGDLKR